MAVFDATAEDSVLRHLEEALGVLEKHLQGRTWVATGELSLVDLSVAAGLYWGFAKVIDRKMRDKYSRTTEYYKQVIGAEDVKEVFREGQFVEVRQDRPV